MCRSHPPGSSTEVYPLFLYLGTNGYRSTKETWCLKYHDNSVGPVIKYAYQHLFISVIAKQKLRDAQS